MCMELRRRAERRRVQFIPRHAVCRTCATAGRACKFSSELPHCVLYSTARRRGEVTLAVPGTCTESISSPATLRQNAPPEFAQCCAPSMEWHSAPHAAAVPPGGQRLALSSSRHATRNVHANLALKRYTKSGSNWLQRQSSPKKFSNKQ